MTLPRYDLFTDGLKYARTPRGFTFLFVCIVFTISYFMFNGDFSS